jgi:chromosome segregation ATPase
MEYMEQQMQNQIESGMSEAARCYKRIAELEAECLRLESCLASKTEIANQLKEGLADAFEREMNLKAERDALVAQVETLKTAYKDLCGAINDLDETDSDSEEIIDEMWGQVFSVMQDGWNSLSHEPQQHLAEIRAEALDAEAMQWPEDPYTECSHVRESILASAAKIRQGGAK